MMRSLVAKSRLLVLALMLGVCAACSSWDTVESTRQDENLERVTRSIWYLHDDVRHVGCWIGYEYGVSCIPDSQLQR